MVKAYLCAVLTFPTPREISEVNDMKDRGIKVELNRTPYMRDVRITSQPPSSMANTGGEVYACLAETEGETFDEASKKARSLFTTFPPFMTIIACLDHVPSAIF